MKNKIRFIAVIAIIGLALIGCKDEGNDNPCAKGHAFPEWTTPTCTEEGNSERTCTRCSALGTRTDGYAALGHDMKLVEGGNVIEAPTCTETGIGETACAREDCGHTEEDGVIDALGHDMKEDWAVFEAETCEEDGEEERFCHRECGHREELPLPKLGHHMVSSGNDFTPATCVNVGFEELACDNEGCDRTVAGAQINTLNHNYGAWGLYTAETCTADGLDERFCARVHGGVACNEEGFRSTQVRKSPGHDPVYLDGANMATCLTAGSGAQKCSVCNADLTSLTQYPALNHYYGAWAIHTHETCTANGLDERFCTRQRNGSACSETGFRTTQTRNALTHQWVNNWVITKHPTCVANGDRERTCARPLHNSLPACTQKEPDNNSTSLPSYNGHHYPPTIPATCTTASVRHNCDRQLQRVGQANHICDADNEELVVNPLGHTGTVTPFAATCTTAGNSVLSGNCVRFAQCAHVVTGTVLAALGHSWNWTTYNSSNGHVSCNRGNCSSGLAAIGDTGPAGGTIFYVAPSGITIQGYTGATGSFAEYTAYYLEAAPADEAISLWQAASNNTLIDGITTWANATAKDAGLAASIGVGRKDTQTIVNSAAFAVLTNTAAQRCTNKNTGGKTDWFLPSLGELNEMYKARVAGVTGIPTSGMFWSSSQGSNDDAWCRYLHLDYQGSNNKILNYFARAIRAF